MQNLSNYSALSLDDFDSYEFKRIGIPTFVYLAILCVIGTIGNLHVLIVYSLKYKASTYKTFVLCLTTIDFVACIFCIPSEMYRIMNLYTIQSAVFCKISNAVIYVTGACSLALLDVIALERYRKVCQATRSQFTVSTARIVCASVIVFLLIIFIPITLIFDIMRKDTEYYFLVGYECTVHVEYIHFTLVKIYLAVMLFMFILLLIVCLALYSMVGRTLYVHRNRQQGHDSKQKTEISSRDFSTSTGLSYENDRINTGTRTLSIEVLADETDQSNNDLALNKTKGITIDAQKLRSVSSSRNNTMDITYNTRKKKINKSRNITMMFIIVSVVSFGSYVPYLLLSLIHIADSQVYKSFKGNCAALHLFLGCMFYLNNTINPLVYGFIDQKFQKELCLLYTNAKAKIRIHRPGVLK